MGSLTDIEALIVNELSKRIPNPTIALRAMVLAQLNHESQGFTRTEENLNYSEERLKAVWPTKFTNQSVSYYAHVPERIANHIYAGVNGNGNETSGDGWRYRGRGFIQLTGRENYKRFAALFNPDTLANDLAINIKVSLDFLAALKGFEAAALKGDVYACTKLINGGQNGLKERKAIYFSYIARLSNVKDV